MPIQSLKGALRALLLIAVFFAGVWSHASGVIDDFLWYLPDVRYLLGEHLWLTALSGGLAIGFALQGTLSNFAAGVLLILFRPFKAGDYIEGGGVSGTVEELQVFATILRTPDNKKIIVPNSAVSSGNSTGIPCRRSTTSPRRSWASSSTTTFRSSRSAT